MQAAKGAGIHRHVQDVNHRLGGIAQTCCISHSSKYRKSGNFDNPAQGAKPLNRSTRNLTKNDLTLTSKYGSIRSSWVVYTSKCAVPRKEVPWGLDENPKCLGVKSPKKQFLGPNRHSKPNFRKLKSQYLRKYKSDRYKIWNLASGHQVDFVSGLKIKSNKIQDGDRPPIWKTKNRNNSAAIWYIVTKFSMTNNKSTRKSCTGRSPVRSIGHARSCRRRVATWWKEQTRRSQNCKYLP